MVEDAIDREIIDEINSLEPNPFQRLRQMGDTQSLQDFQKSQDQERKDNYTPGRPGRPPKKYQEEQERKSSNAIFNPTSTQSNNALFQGVQPSIYKKKKGKGLRKRKVVRNNRKF